MVSPAVKVPVPVGTSPRHSALPFAGIVASLWVARSGCQPVQLRADGLCSVALVTFERPPRRFPDIQLTGPLSHDAEIHDIYHLVWVWRDSEEVGCGAAATRPGRW